VADGGEAASPAGAAAAAVEPVTAAVVEASLDRDPLTREAVPVAPGRPPALGVARLLGDGLEAVSGTVELTGERKPAVEEGVPVAISGRVVEKESGAPVPGAAVVLRSTFYLRRIFYDHELVEVARAVTDADGVFRIERLNVDPVHFGSGGLVYLSVDSPEHAPLPAVPLEKVAPGFRNRLPDFVVSRDWTSLHGRVVDLWEGKPVAGARVVATGVILPVQFPKDRRPALFLSAPQATTDEEGRFVLERVGAGRQVLSVLGGDDIAGWMEVRAPFDGEVVLRSRQIRGRIEGKVLDDLGHPLDVVLVNGGDNSTHTFADGSFVLENFRGDPIAIRFEHPDYRPEVGPGVPDGTRGMEVRLASRCPEVFLRVVERDTNRPAKTIVVVFEFANGTVAAAGSPFFVAKKGLFSLAVPEGAVRARISETVGGASETVDLSAARDGVVYDVTL
jgi:hypothetical protein